MIIKVSGHQYWWLAGGYDLEIGHFLEVASMVVSWWIVFLALCLLWPCGSDGWIMKWKLQCVLHKTSLLIYSQ